MLIDFKTTATPLAWPNSDGYDGASGIALLKECVFVSVSAPTVKAIFVA